MLIALLSDASGDPARKIGFIAIVALAGFFCWAFTRWVIHVPSRPDPWDDEIAMELATHETPAVCHRCLEPHATSAHFCENCGAAVGQYTNLLPLDHLYSIGHTLRIGTNGDFKHTPLTVAGFVL